MPLWNIHHTPNLFTDAEKNALASAITSVYTSVGLPRFYVVVLFSEIASSNFYVGGERAETAVRIAVDHIARTLPSAPARQRMTQVLTDVIAPHLKGKNPHWELHVDETSEELWTINGLVPPPANSEAEHAWAAANRTSPY